MDPIIIPPELTNDALVDFYNTDEPYTAQFQDKKPLTRKLLGRYHDSLCYYKHFYDDMYEYGSIENADEILYFLPGYNGTPGQIKFGLPGILKRYGNRIYMKCLHLDEFSCRYPYWIKYTEANLIKRREKIVADIRGLAEHGKTVRVIVSSTGFYDFLAVFHELKDLKDSMKLYWVSCAPDSVSRSKWGAMFYAMNGFTYNDQKWFSYPNKNFLKFMNPECSEKHKWRHGNQRNTFYKVDIESRFFSYGFLWDYISTDNFNFVLEDNLKAFREHGEVMDIHANILSASKDGFWDDSSVANIESTIDKYVKSKSIIWRPTSHLWAVTPHNIYELLAE